MVLPISKEGYLLLDKSGNFTFTLNPEKEGIDLSFERILGFRTISTGFREDGQPFKEVEVIFNPEGLQPLGDQPWPVNGYVVNNSSFPVNVWSDTKGYYTIAANSTSDRFTEDVDHIQDRLGQWYKIGPHTVTVAPNGTISGYECKVINAGDNCP